MRERLWRFSISLGEAGRRGSWDALGQSISRHGSAGSVHISANSHSRLWALESSGVRLQGLG